MLNTDLFKAREKGTIHSKKILRFLISKDKIYKINLKKLLERA